MDGRQHAALAKHCFSRYEEKQSLVDEWEAEARAKSGSDVAAAILLRDEKGYKDAIADRKQFMNRALLSSAMAIMLKLYE